MNTFRLLKFRLLKAKVIGLHLYCKSIAFLDKMLTLARHQASLALYRLIAFL